MKKTFSITLSLLTVYSVLLISSVSAQTWEGPKTPPPPQGTNISAPLNVGAGAQTKQGPLTVAGITLQGGDLYLGSGKALRIDTAAGNTATLYVGNWGGIGGEAQALTLEVVGQGSRVKAPELCIGNVCKTEWPTPTTATAYTAGQGIAITNNQINVSGGTCAERQVLRRNDTNTGWVCSGQNITAGVGIQIDNPNTNASASRGISFGYNAADRYASINAYSGNHLTNANTLQLAMNQGPGSNIALVTAGGLRLLVDDTGKTIVKHTLCFGNTDAANCRTSWPSSGAVGSFVNLQATTPGTAQTGNINVSGAVVAGSFSGSGALLTNLDASRIASGTLAHARVASCASGEILKYGASGWVCAADDMGTSGLTQTDADTRYVNTAGDTMTGNLKLSNHDLYFSDTTYDAPKAIRVDRDGPSILNIGNWGGAGGAPQQVRLEVLGPASWIKAPNVIVGDGALTVGKGTAGYKVVFYGGTGGAGEGFLYNSAKNALRVGQIRVPDDFNDVNIGLRSLAIGYQNAATAEDAVAIGKYVDATAANALVIGRGVSATSKLVNSTADSLKVGFGSITPMLYVKDDVYAGGTGDGNKVCRKSGVNCPASGGGLTQTTADATYLNVSGDTMTGPLTVGSNGAGHHVQFYGGTAGQKFLWNSSLGSVEVGLNTQATQLSTIAMGNGAKALAVSAIALGSFSYASGYQSAALGSGSATNTRAVAIGNTSNASGVDSTAMGSGTAASGDESLALGTSTTASARNAIAIGKFVTASADSALVLGRGANGSSRLVNDTPNSLLIGFGSTRSLFVTQGDVYVGSGTAEGNKVCRKDGTNCTVKFPTGSSDPACSAAGLAYFNTSTNRIRVCNGTSWIQQ